MYCEDKDWPNWPMAPWPYTFKYRKNLIGAAARDICACSRYKIIDRKAVLTVDGIHCNLCTGVLRDRLHKCRECNSLYVQDWHHPNHCPRYSLCLDCFQDVPTAELCVEYGQKLHDHQSIVTKFDSYPPPKPMSMSDIDSLLEGL